MRSRSTAAGLVLAFVAGCSGGGEPSSDEAGPTSAVSDHSPTATAPPGMNADEGFAALGGPFAGLVIRPDDFTLELRPFRTRLEELAGQVDGTRLESTVRELARPRSVESPTALRSTATDLEGRLTATGLAPETDPVQGREVEAPNVRALIGGTDCPDRLLILNAHYDTVPGSPGADDNASGVAAVLEVARILSESPLPISVQISFLAHEEVGLLGALAEVARIEAEQLDVAGIVNLDMVGYTDPGPDTLTGLPAEYLPVIANPASRSLAASFGAAAYAVVPDFLTAAVVIEPLALPNILRSDHAAFWLRGTPGLFLTDTANIRNPNYHRPTDTPDTLDYDFLTNVTRATVAGVAAMALGDEDGDDRPDLCHSSGPD